MINWQRHLSEQLKTYADRSLSRDNIKQRLSDLNTRIISPRLANTKGTRISGDCSKMEDQLLSYLAEKYELEDVLAKVEIDLNHIERGLAKLTFEEQAFLSRFYFERQNIDQIADELHIDKSTLYRRRDNILRKLCHILYGTTQT